MVDFIEFFRLFDFPPWDKGPNGRFYLIFSTFRLFDLEGKVQMVDLMNFFDFSTFRPGGEGPNGRFF